MESAKAGKAVARVGAAAFVLGLTLAGPQVAVAAADGQDDVTSNNAADQATGSSRAGAVRSTAGAGGRGGLVSRPAGSLRGAPVTPMPAAVERSARAATGVAPQHRAAIAVGDSPDSVDSDGSAEATSVLHTPSTAVPQRVSAPAAVTPAAVLEDEIPLATLEEGETSTPDTVGPALQSPGLTAAVSSSGSPTAATAAAPALSELNTAVVGFFESTADWLSSLPANPISDLLSGALLLVRRSLFNQLPTADAVQVEMVENGFGQIEGAIKAVDPEGDPLTYTVVTAPQFGTVELNAADGTYVYTPDDDPATIDDNFSVAVSDNGFNVLMPLESRAVDVQSFVGGGMNVSSPNSQGFRIVNLTNSVVWLTGIQPDFTTAASREAWLDTCADLSFCNGMLIRKTSIPVWNGNDFGGAFNYEDRYVTVGTDKSGTALNPGDAMRFELATDATAWLNFYAPDISAPGSTDPTWRVQAYSLYSSGSSYIRLCTPGGSNGGCGTDNAMRQFDAVGNLYQYNYFNGSGPGVVSYAQGEEGGIGQGRTLFLVGSTQDPALNGAAWTAGRVVTIGPDATFTTKAPSWCRECRDVAALDATDVFQNLLAFGGYKSTGGTIQANGTYSNSFKTSYRNVTYSNDPNIYKPTKYTTKESGETPVVLYNGNPQSGSSITYNWTVKAAPEAPPNNPWWQKLAAKGLGALATKLIDQIPVIGSAISKEVGSAVEGALSPEEVKAPRTLTGQATLVQKPYSVAVLTTGVSNYNVTGDMSFTVAKCDQRGSTRCSNYSFSDQIKSGDIVTYAFPGMNWNVVPKNPQYSATFTYVPYAPPGLDGKPQVNKGLNLRDAETGSIFPRGYRVGEFYPLTVTAFRGTGIDAQAGSDFSQFGCDSSGGTGCTTFTVSDPTVAEIEVIEGQALLVPLKAGRATVTATYNWLVPQAGAPALTGYVTATLPFIVAS